jgi:hypothetical protein
MLEIVTFTAPHAWASALINGDMSGYSDAECALIEKACVDLCAKYGNAFPVDVSEAWFSAPRTGYYGDGLAGDYAEYSLLVDSERLRGGSAT